MKILRGAFLFSVSIKVYLVHLKVKHCQTCVVSTFTGQNYSKNQSKWAVDWF